MENKNQKDKSTPKSSGTSKEKATFDQNGKGSSDEFGKAGKPSSELENDKNKDKK